MNRGLKSVLRACQPSRVGPRRILAGPLRGAAIVTSWHDYPAAILGRTERELIGWFARHVRPGDTWLDVGAHYGYTAIALSRFVGPSGRVFAFEPSLSTAGHLARTRRLNGLEQLVVLPLALGATGTIEMQRSATVRGMLDPSGEAARHEEMLTASLDWLWPRIRRDEARIDGIKIDVQGMEIDVLRGAVDILKAQAPSLIVEVHPSVSRAALLEVLRSVGYTRPGVAVEPVAGETQPAYVDDRSYFFSAGAGDR